MPNKKRHIDWELIKKAVLKHTTSLSLSKAVGIPEATLIDRIRAEYGVGFTAFKENVHQGIGEFIIKPDWTNEYAEKKEGPAKANRKPKQIVWAEVEEFFKSGYSIKSLCHEIKVSPQDFEMAVQKQYSQTAEEYRQLCYELGNDSLKKKLYDLAMSGQPTIAVWVSRQRLGYSEKPNEIVDENAKPPTLVLNLVKKHYGEGEDIDFEELDNEGGDE
jgi:hypothetical protein